MSLIGQLIFDGLAIGLIYAILASGMVIIMSVSKILFMAYAAFYTLGAYATWYGIYHYDLPYFLSLVIGVLVTSILAILSYVLIFQHLQERREGFFITLIASLGLSMILTQGTLLLFGTVPRTIKPVFSGIIHWLGMNISIDKLVLISLSVIATLSLFWVYEKTNIGRQMRAVAFLPEAASLQGINRNRIYLIALVVGTGLASIAGGILAPTYGLNPEMGGSVLWTVILMIMLGGLDSLVGAVLGGLLIGQMLSFGQYFIGHTVQILVFLIIGVVLYFKPTGLLGGKIDIKV